MRSRLVILALSAACCALPADAAVYKWVDENGTVQFSQTPPPGGAFETVRPPPPPVEDPGAARQRLDEKLQQIKDAEARQKQQQEDAQKQAADRARRDKTCATLREALAQMENTPGPRLLLTEADGGQRRMSEEERVAEVEKIKARLAKDCARQ